MQQQQRLDGIPTAPNSPADIFALNTKSPSPSLSLGDWSEIDMVSSIESLARHSPRPASSEAFRHGLHSAGNATTPLQHVVPDELSPLMQFTDTQISGDASANSATAASATASHAADGALDQSSQRSSVSHYDFVMPSLPKVDHRADDPVIGLLHLAIVGSHGHAVLSALASRMFDQHKEVREDGVESTICSSSAYEHSNIVLDDANFTSQEIPRWLEIQLQRECPIDLVIYALGPEGASEEDISVMAEIQNLSELAVVIADAEPAQRNLDMNAMLQFHGVSGIHKRVWFISTKMDHNWDMTASAVEAPGFRSFTVSDSEGSELSSLVASLMSSSGRIRAAASLIQSRWFQSQLVVTITEPAGALAHRVNLRRKALESIGNIDPLGIVQWSSVPRITSALLVGLVAGALAALGSSTVCSRLICNRAAQPSTKRHTLLDMENWPQWLV